jgi:uncharacterized membrane protein HdeD (DUF308 family)
MAQPEQQLPGLLANGACEFCRRTWWVFLIGGLASIAFGVLAFFNPGAALLVLGIFLAAWLLVDGVVNVWGAVTNRDKDGWVAILLLGILGIVLGGYALWVPAISMMAIVYIVAFMALLLGVSSLYLGWRIRREVSTEWILYLTGALSVIFAGLILLRPTEGSVTVVYLIATWAVLIGALRVFFAFQIRKVGNRVETLTERTG